MLSLQQYKYLGGASHRFITTVLTPFHRDNKERPETIALGKGTEDFEITFEKFILLYRKDHKVHFHVIIEIKNELFEVPASGALRCSLRLLFFIKHMYK